jgi:predicted  nucleic acid-binding Zn-ribbon protein
MVKGANAGEKATKENAQAISNLRDKFLDLSASLQVAEARQQEFGRNTPKSVVLANALAIEKYKREMAQTSVEQAKLTDEAAGGKSKLAAFARVAGVTQEEFKTLVNTNPATAFEKIIHGLKRIETEEGIGAQLQALKDIGVTNVRELLVFQTLANSPEQLSDALQKANAQWAEGGALQTEVQKAMQDTANQLTAIKNRIEADFIPVWDQQFRPAIEKASTFMQQSLIPNMETWIGALNTMDPEVLKNVGLAFAGLAALGPVLFVIGQIISIIALLASPAGVIFAAIAAIVALKLAWDNNWFGIRDTTFKVIDAVHDKMAELAIGMRTVFANAIGGLAQVFATIGGLLPSTFGQPFKDAAAALEAYKRNLDEATLAKSNALTASNIVQAQTGSTALNPVLQGDVGTLAPAVAPLPILNQQQVGDAGMNFMAPVVEFSGPLTIANGIDAQNVANQAAAAVLQALIDSEQASAAPVTQPLPGAPTGFEGRSILAR